MAKKINLIVNTGNEETSKTIEVVIDNGKKGSAGLLASGAKSGGQAQRI